MTNPFKIDGPAVVSFSGGRTSGLLLRRILDAGVQPDVHVLFANTGKERDETLDFVRDCSTRWGISVTWLQRPPFASDHPTGFVVVDYATAARQGDDNTPFDQLITERRCLPNPAQRWCTQELKLRPMEKWMLAQGYEHWDAATGVRFDEPRRVARARQQNEERSNRYTQVLPLAEAMVTEADVMAFWSTQPFDLQLEPYEGNCTNCFLKHLNKRERIAKEHPDLNAWWIEQERRTGQFFRRDEPEYKLLPMIGNLFDAEPGEDLIECHCTD